MGIDTKGCMIYLLSILGEGYIIGGRGEGRLE